MRTQRFIGAASISLVVSLFVASCTSAATDTTIVAAPTSTSSTVETSTLPATSTTAPPALPQDRWISIEDDSFVDDRTETPFVPIGVNLLGGHRFSTLSEGVRFVPPAGLQLQALYLDPESHGPVSQLFALYATTA